MTARTYLSQSLRLNQRINSKLEQIQSLMTQINATTDQKSVQEIQARIGAENALLAHESSQIQMLQGMADSDMHKFEQQGRKLKSNC